MDAIIYLSYPLIIYLIICIILIISKDYIIKYYKYITSYYSWYAVNIFLLLYSLIFTKGLWIYCVYTLYLITVYIITKIGNNSDYFIFGILIALFQSEYWEQPIYIFNGMLNIPPLIIYLYIIYTMYFILKKNYLPFIISVFMFTAPYYMFVYIAYPSELFRNCYLISDFVFRIICSIWFIFSAHVDYSIYKKTYMNDSYVDLGGTDDEYAW